MRGVIPSEWTRVTAPAQEKVFFERSLPEGRLGPGCLGQGARDQPLYVFGDASGGKDTHDSRLRRVGCAVA
eukprot:4487270-Pyramimonas_sp.AAC.1